MSVLVACPVLNRPQRAKRLYQSFHASLLDEPAELVFLCSPGDKAEIKACRATPAMTVVVPFANAPGDYARKINFALTLGEHEWIFTGADDLHFHKGWIDEAMTMHRRFHFRVLGTNDLGNPAVKRGRHSTHSFVHRSYATELGTVDEPGLIYHQGYHHNWCDAELVETAQARREFLFVQRSIVEHLHPHWHKGDHDDTYALGLAEFDGDHRLYLRRRRKWLRRRTRRGVLL